MSERTLRELLNRLRWDAASNPAVVLVWALSRNAGRATARAVAFASVAEILAAGVLLADGTFLPYHRILRVSVGGETVWQSREGGHNGGT